MKFKKINENKIIILLSGEELESRNLDISNIRDNSVAYQKLFWDMMEHAQEELGFDVSGSQLMVETSPDKNGNIVITITKSIGIRTPVGSIEKLVSEILSNPVDELGISAGLVIPENEYECISFENVDNLIDFCKSIEGLTGVSTSLFNFEGKYYLTFKRTKRNSRTVTSTLDAASEFTGMAGESGLLYALLEERGRRIIKTKAVRTLAESFK